MQITRMAHEKLLAAAAHERTEAARAEAANRAPRAPSASRRLKAGTTMKRNPMMNGQHDLIECAACADVARVDIVQHYQPRRPSETAERVKAYMKRLHETGE